MSQAGYDACEKTVQRLIAKIARQVFAAGDLSPVPDSLQAALPATRSSLPEYFNLNTFAEREEYHARLNVYVRAGAIHAKWDKEAGKQGQLARVALVDTEALARLHATDLPWIVARDAISSLHSVHPDLQPVLENIRTCWRHGKEAGGISTEMAQQFIDCLKVIDSCRDPVNAGKDILMRRLSVQLFGNSKRIEALRRSLSYLLRGANGAAESFDSDDCFDSLGVIKHPQPVLLSGPVGCTVSLATTNLNFVPPYIGVAPDTVQGLGAECQQIRRILTIENLASFNEAARAETNPTDLLLMYVAGNPTPSLLGAYRRIIRSMGVNSVLHWGDVDVGGFRIASRLADAAREEGHRLDLFWMCADESDRASGERFNEVELQSIVRTCERHGWERERTSVIAHPFSLEQELKSWRTDC